MYETKSEVRQPGGLLVWVFLAIWTLLVAASFVWNDSRIGYWMTEVAKQIAKMATIKDKVYRSWNAQMGAVYVPVTQEMQPNILLKTHKRDVSTKAGSSLTMVNPAFMTRLANEIQERQYHIRGRLTSLNPINDQNRPMPFEEEALRKFENTPGLNEVVYVRDEGYDPYLMLMVPLRVEEGCLKCHAEQGYNVGDLRGGLTAVVPLAELREERRTERSYLGASHLALWLVGAGGVLLFRCRAV
jgi:hypothetical protein